MAVLREIRYRAKQVILPVVGACVLGYFVYHSVQGDHGLFAYWHIKQEIARAQVALNTVRTERVALEHRVDLLHPDSLDPDMLDERARHVLNVVRPDEVVIFLDQPKQG